MVISRRLPRPFSPTSATPFFIVSPIFFNFFPFFSFSNLTLSKQFPHFHISPTFHHLSSNIFHHQLLIVLFQISHLFPLSTISHSSTPSSTFYPSFSPFLVLLISPQSSPSSPPFFVSPIFRFPYSSFPPFLVPPISRSPHFSFPPFLASPISTILVFFILPHSTLSFPHFHHSQCLSSKALSINCQPPS